MAAHVDMDGQRLVLWGYTTHTQLRSAGTYDEVSRTYCLKDLDLVQDFSAFWVAQYMGQSTYTPVDTLPSLSEAQAKSLIQDLARVPEPRLALPFSQWGALISNQSWRQQIYQLRQSTTPINVEDWLNHIFEQGWHPLETLLPQTQALRFRSTATRTAVLTCGKKICLNTSPDEL